jgi:hypothetical protein
MPQKPIGTEHGTLIKVKCPHCREPHRFEVIEQAISGLLRLFGGRNNWLLVCDGCQYSIDIDPVDVSIIVELLEKAEQMKAGELTDDAYYKLIIESQAGCIANLIIDSQPRPCPACGEEVPPTFADCWSCNEPMPDGSVKEAEPAGDVGDATLDPISGKAKSERVQTEES